MSSDPFSFGTIPAALWHPLTVYSTFVENFAVICSVAPLNTSGLESLNLTVFSD